MKVEEHILAEVLEQPASERAGWVARMCGEDELLHRRMLALLRGYDGAGAKLEESPVASPSARTCAHDFATSREYAPGATIGRYKLLQKIGEGGWGVVFLAEQLEPVQRRVAVKVIKLGMDTQEVIARFEAERQALALMDHPHIARVLDAGATEQGRPFFVMELVAGVPITQFCDQHNVSALERIRLFTQVCSAVEHAHQKGIIHRDLKPSNVLVALDDGVPVPKIIDFGIAKAMNGRLDDHSLFTAVGQFIGTPAYMSPEQLEMGGVDIDTRSDIYSLGVLLYELLTGRPPFESRDLLQAGLDEMRRIIREQEPDRPSTRISTLNHNDRVSIARMRATDPTRLSTWLRGDVDWIVMRCLEKDRTRRYETASGLRLDLHRYLRHEPITARPPSTLYALRKLVLRNRLVFGAATAVLLALVTGLGFSSLALRRERAARQSADFEASRSAQLTRLMQDMLAGVGPQVSIGRDTRLLRTILDETVVRLDQQLRGEPEVEASFRATLGHVYRDLGELAAAVLMHQRALQLRREHFGLEHTAVADSLHELGDVLGRQGRLDESECMLREALVVREKRLGAEHADTAATRRALAHVQLLMRPGGELGAKIQSHEQDFAPPGNPTVIRVALAGGTVGGKPLMPDVLSVAYQQRALEQEFESDGIRIEWTSPSYYTASETIARGVPDFSTVGPVKAWVARATRLNYKIVMPLHGPAAPMALVVRADSPFQSLADLKGKRLGNCAGSRSHLALCRILENHGLREADFNVIAFPGIAALETAFSSGEVEARVIETGPTAEQGRLRHVRVISALDREQMDSGGKLAVATDFERQYPVIVQRLVRTLVRVAAWSADERNRPAVLASWAHSPAHQASLASVYDDEFLRHRTSPLMDDHYIAALRRDGDDARRFGLLPANADLGLDGWIEPKYVRHALKELRLQGYWSERHGNNMGSERLQ